MSWEVALKMEGRFAGAILTVSSSLLFGSGERGRMKLKKQDG